MSDPQGLLRNEEVTAAQARAIASDWVALEGSNIPGFRGAYFAGSIASLPNDAALASWTDVDIMVVLDGEPPDKIGKLVRDGVLLEISFLAHGQLRTPEAILGHYHLAHSFANATIITDPTGDLTSLRTEVARGFATRSWVETRCADARTKVETGFRALNPAVPFHEQVLTWVFPTGVLTHILLVAGLRNPTVRRRYEETLRLLTDHRRIDLYESLLDLLGCGQMSRERVERHLASVGEVFDAAAKVGDAPFPFASDISVVARPIAVDGSQDMIGRGYHREAVFWLVVTYSRCLAILDHAASVPQDHRFREGYRRLLGDLGIHTFPDLRLRAEQALELLPRVREVANEIILANPDIEGGSSDPILESP